MANKFTDSFNNSNQNLFSQFAAFRQNPNEYLQQRGINVPPEYQNSPEQMAKYLLSNMPANQQNGILQKVNMIRGMFGM